MQLPDWLNKFRTTKAYDILTAAPLILWFGRNGWHDAQNVVLYIPRLRAGRASAADILQFATNSTAVLFCALLILMLLQRTLPRTRASGIAPRAMAVIGTFLANGFLAFPPVPLPLSVLTLASALMFGGLALCVVVMLWLGRSFAIMPEARELVTGGPYAIVRHPLYVAETIAVSSMVILRFNAWAVLLFAAYVAVQAGRAMFEERILADTFPSYAAYAARTKRFIPYLY